VIEGFSQVSYSGGLLLFFILGFVLGAMSWMFLHPHSKKKGERVQ
jgi:hypothetical protein